jgi:hypothetical protein
LAHVATFIQTCDARVREDAEWMMEETLQSYDDGVANIKKTPFAVKMMEYGMMADKEVKVQDWFRSHPYRHIVQGICSFSCKESLIQWKSRLPAPQPFCKNTGDTMVKLIVQEYIPGGDLDKPREWSVALWKSVLFQLTFACFEFYDMGFYYGDWNFGNILLDTTNETYSPYNVFGKKIKIPTEGVCPVLTDFARSLFIANETRILEHLTDNIGSLWSFMRHKCPIEEWKQWLNQKSIDIGKCSSKTAIFKLVKEVQSHTGAAKSTTASHRGGKVIRGAFH